MVTNTPIHVFLVKKCQVPGWWLQTPQYMYSMLRNVKYLADGYQHSNTCIPCKEMSSAWLMVTNTPIHVFLVKKCQVPGWWLQTPQYMYSMLRNVKYLADGYQHPHTCIPCKEMSSTWLMVTNTHIHVFLVKKCQVPGWRLQTPPYMYSLLRNVKYLADGYQHPNTCIPC